MRPRVTDGDVADAAQQLARDRAEIALVLAPAPPDLHDRFPRSATFRWIIGHFSGRSVAATGGALLLRMAVRRMMRAAAR